MFQSTEDALYCYFACCLLAIIVSLIVSKNAGIRAFRICVAVTIVGYVSIKSGEQGFEWSMSQLTDDRGAEHKTPVASFLVGMVASVPAFIAGVLGFVMSTVALTVINVYL